MRIVVIMQDLVEIKKIVLSLGLPDYRAPPALPKGRNTEFEQCCLDELPD